MHNDLSRSRELYKEATGLIPGGVNSPVRAFGKVGGDPVFVRSASGSRFRDEDNNEYVDFCMSWGPLILGHSHPKVVEAVREAAPCGLSYGTCHRKEIELAALVLDAFPGYDRVRMVNSGTEAVMTALRIARGVTDRSLVIKFEGGYHGHCDGMLVKAGSGLATQAIADSSGVPSAIAGTTLVAELDDESSVKRLFDSHGDDIAALIIEPLPANNGLLMQRQDFLRFLRDITSRYGALLIFDEVISGFRLNFGGYGQLVGITPDLSVLGKIIGGGMPVGAVAGKAEIMDVLAPTGSVYQAGTLSGNPVSLAAGIATLSILRDDPPYDVLERLGRKFVEELSATGKTFARAQQAGSILWLYLDEKEFPRQPEEISPVAVDRFNDIYQPILRQGYYLPPSPYEVIFLSTAHAGEEVTGLARAINEELGHT